MTAKMTQLFDVKVTNRQTGNKLNLLVWAMNAAEAKEKLTGALIGPGCEYSLRGVEPHLERGRECYHFEEMGS